MRDVSPTPVRSAIHAVLTRDTLVLLYLAIAVTELLLFALPVLDPATRKAFGSQPFQIPLVATVCLAGFSGLGRMPDREERTFWRYLAAACAVWLTTLAAVALIPAEYWTWRDEVWSDAAYLCFYLLILFAADCKPHVAGPVRRYDLERPLRWAGVTLITLGWFGYFIIAPAAEDPLLFETMQPSSLLFLTVDGAIVIRFAWRACASGSARWRVLYGTIALAGVALAATDALEALGHLGLVALTDGEVTDLLWALPPFLLLLAFRLRDADMPRAAGPSAVARTPGAELDAVRVGSLLVTGAFSFPLVHFVLHEWLRFTEPVAAAQRLIVVAELVLLGSLAVTAFIYLERRRVEEERRRAALEERVRRARSLEAVSRMAGVVTGEYGPALKAIGAFTDRAIDALGPGDPLRDDVLRAANRLQRLVEFTDTLKAIGRQERGQPARLDLREAVQDRVPELRRLLGPSIRLESGPSREACLTVIDPAHLTAVLRDLATNARDAMPGGGRCRIETGARDLDGDAAIGMGVRPGRYATLTVRDTGSGVPKDLLPRLFEPFFSTKLDNGPCAGLGLATVYALASHYGGTVTVTSEPGDTAFEVLLPSPR